MREQAVEVLEVALEPLLDVGELLGAALQIGGRRRRADGRAGRHGVAPPVDGHAHGHEQVRAAEGDEPEHEPGQESSVATKFTGSILRACIGEGAQTERRSRQAAPERRDGVDHGKPTGAAAGCQIMKSGALPGVAGDSR